MALKSVVESLEDVPEELHEDYEQDQDGKYVIKKEIFEDHPGWGKLKKTLNSLDKEKRQRGERADSLEKRFKPLLEFEDLDLSDVEPERVEQLRPYLTGEQDIPSGDPKDGERKTPEEIERIRQNARKPLEKELSKKEEGEKFWRSVAENTLTKNALQGEFSRAGVKDPDFLELLIERYSPKCKIEFDGNEPKVMIDSEYGEVNPKEFCKEWSGTDYAKKFIAASENNGGGANGGGSNANPKNPWDPANFDMEEQSRIYRENPERAKQMAAKFGKRVGVQ